MTSITCRQCGHASSREEHGDNRFRCPWCDWREVLPPPARGPGGDVASACDADAPVEHDAPASVDHDAPATPVSTTAAPASTAPLDPGLLDDLSQREFVLWCADLLSRFGYAVTVPDEADEADADLEIARHGTVTLVLCRTADDEDAIGRAVCQQLVGAMAGRQATRGMIITTGTFADGAVGYVVRLGGVTLELIDGDEVRATLAAMDAEPLRKWWGSLAPATEDRAAA